MAKIFDKIRAGVRDALRGHEEVLPHHRYAVEETRPSQVDPDATIRVEVGTLCPRCKTLLKGEWGHGEERTCPDCDLHMQLWGNGLHCYP